MKLNFIFSHLHALVLAVWVVFLIIVAIRFFRQALVKNISFFKLIVIAIGFIIFYGLFVSWGQYYVWATSSDVTRSLLDAPLSKQVPFPVYLEFIRPFFENHFGYFLFYILGRVWLNILISFLISGILYFLFRVWQFYRGGFLSQCPELLLFLMLISGFPGVLVSVPLGFVLSILLFGFSYLKGNKVVHIEPVFIFTTLFALLFTRMILNVL